MKDFLKYTLATVVGIILTSIIITVISIVSVAGMVASEGAASSVPKNSVLRIKLQGEIEERAGEGSPMDFLSQGEVTTIGLDQALEALKKAAKAYAVVSGRDYVIPDDVKLMAPYVLGHRLMLTPQGNSRYSDRTELVKDILTHVSTVV